MHRIYGGRTFAYCSRDPAIGAGAHITGRKNTWHTGFKCIRCARQRPAARPTMFDRQIRACEHEP